MNSRIRFLYQGSEAGNIRIRVDGGVAGILDLGCIWNSGAGLVREGETEASALPDSAGGKLPGKSDCMQLGSWSAVCCGNVTRRTVKTICVFLVF